MAKKRKLGDDDDDDDGEDLCSTVGMNDHMEDKVHKEEEEKDNPNPNSDQTPDSDSEYHSAADDDDEEEEEEDITKLLEPFNKQQLIQILQNAASNHPQILKEIHRLAHPHFTHRKLYVHGLNRDTTTATMLRDFFSKYGEVEDSIVAYDDFSSKSRGYGFVLFKHRESAQKALKDRPKTIDNRFVFCNLASEVPSNDPYYTSNYSQRKVFVGNVLSHIPAYKLITLFSKYGELEKAPVGFDAVTGKSRGYAIIVYRTVEGAKKALEEPIKSLDGVHLYCERAKDYLKQPENGNTSNRFNSAAMGGLGGGGSGNNGPNGVNVGGSGGGGTCYGGGSGCGTHGSGGCAGGNYGVGDGRSGLQQVEGFSALVLLFIVHFMFLLFCLLVLISL